MNHELVMPKKYVDLSEDEMEYDGGLFNFLVAAVASVASVGLGIYANVTGSKAALAASYACTAISVVCSFGVSSAVTLVTKGVATKTVASVASKVVNVSDKTALSTYNGVKTAYTVTVSAPSTVIKAGLAYDRY